MIEEVDVPAENIGWHPQFIQDAEQKRRVASASPACSCQTLKLAAI